MSDIIIANKIVYEKYGSGKYIVVPAILLPRDTSEDGDDIPSNREVILTRINANEFNLVYLKRYDSISADYPILEETMTASFNRNDVEQVIVRRHSKRLFSIENNQDINEKIDNELGLSSFIYYINEALERLDSFIDYDKEDRFMNSVASSYTENYEKVIKGLKK